MYSIDIDEGLAALIAAAAAVWSAYFSVRASRVAAHLSARQSVVGDDLKELSSATYEVVALSVAAIGAKDMEKFDEKIKAATDVAVRLDDLRRRHRYSLPFIFDAVWYLKGMPLYVAQYRNRLDDPNLVLLKERATALREAIDASLEDYFFRGKAPKVWTRWQLGRKGRRLESTFKDGKRTD